MLVGRNEQGVLVYIDDVNSTDEIKCPECDETLIQKRGNIRVHHFAHKSGSNCNNTGMTWQHMAIQKFLKEFFIWASPYESQVEKRISWRDVKVIADYFVECDICGQWHMDLCFEVVEANDNYAHYAEKMDKYYLMDQQVVWVFDEEKLQKKIDGKQIKLNAMQEAIMRDTGQIISVSSKHRDGFYIRKLYFPSGKWRKQTCNIYSTRFVQYVRDLKVIPSQSHIAILIRDGDDIMDNLNGYYNVWWSNKTDKSDDWEQSEEYANTFIRSGVKGVVAEDYTYPDKLLVFDEADEVIASIPKNRLYEGLKYGDEVHIISKGNGYVSVEKKGSVKQSGIVSGKYDDLLAKFKHDKSDDDDVELVEQENLDNFIDEMEEPLINPAEKELIGWLTAKYESLCKEAEYYKKILESMGGL